VSSTTKRITIDLLRHGEPEGGEVLRGRINHALTQQGWQQMRDAIAQIQARDQLLKWTHIVTSPLKRCSAFADVIAQQQGLPLQTETSWQEIDYGDWDGMQLAHWREQAGPMFQEFRRDMSRLQPPNGENFVTFKNRVLQAWQDLQSLPDNSHVLLVTHGGVLRVILPTVLGMPLNRSQPLHIPFASCSRVSIKVAGEHVHAQVIFHSTAD